VDGGDLRYRRADSSSPVWVRKRRIGETPPASGITGKQSALASVESNYHKLVITTGGGYPATTANPFNINDLRQTDFCGFAEK
jgi:hypothetical protein